MINRKCSSASRAFFCESDDKDNRRTSPEVRATVRRSIRGLTKGRAERTRDQQAQSPMRYDRAIGRALALQARATGNLGKTGRSHRTGQKSFDTYPTPESARETGKWLAKAGKEVESLDAMPTHS